MLQWKSKVLAVLLVSLLVAASSVLGNFTWALFNFTW
jgi:hypothetical protein